MSFLKIEDAARPGAKLIIAFAGQSGSGKTLSAILFAYGLTNGNGSEVGFLDTENERGKLYASAGTWGMVKESLALDAMPGAFKYANFPAPHSPSRYIDAIRQFEALGVKVLVIDSVSHEYEGIGGICDIAEAGLTPGKPKRWNKAKDEHRKFMNVLLQSSMHVIVCVRAREKIDMKTDPSKPVSLGVLPIQEKNFTFEMTASLMMWNNGKEQDTLKCPAELLPHLGRREGYITAEDGRNVREWLNGGESIDHAAKSALAQLHATCAQGVEAMRAAWDKVTPKMKKALKDELPGLRNAAKSYDDQRALSKADAGTSGAEALKNIIAAKAGNDLAADGGGDAGGEDMYK